jgi:hypothetical protein
MLHEIYRGFNHHSPNICGVYDNNETFSVEMTKQKTNRSEIEESLRWMPTLVRSNMARRRVSWIE